MQNKWAYKRSQKVSAQERRPTCCLSDWRCRSVKPLRCSAFIILNGRVLIIAARFGRGLTDAAGFVSRPLVVLLARYSPLSDKLEGSLTLKGQQVAMQKTVSLSLAIGWDSWVSTPSFVNLCKKKKKGEEKNTINSRITELLVSHNRIDKHYTSQVMD